MSSDIEKLAVFDARIVQQRPKYAVEKGALSLTNSPFNAIAATPTQHTYNIYVPSENVFVDRGVDWTSTVYMSFVSKSVAAVAAGDVICAPARDFALCAFPLNSLCSTVTATINDTTTVINTQDVLKEVLRLADYSDNRKQRLCPTMLDTYASYADTTATSSIGGQATISTPVAGWNDTRGVDYVPNGAYPTLVFTLPDGTLAADQTIAAGNNGGLPYDFKSGLPVAPPGGYAGGNLTFYVAWRSTEKIVLSPFTFADVHEWDTGLFGINNIQLIMNLLSSPARVLRFNNVNIPAPDLTDIQYNLSVPQGTFQGSRVNVQFLTPSLDVPLPPKSVVPYMEFPRYISQPATPIDAGKTGQLVSQTITLPQIPDLFIIYAKIPANQLLSTDGDFYLPPATAFDGVPSPLTVNFDNFSGLLSSVTAEQLYQMSVKNGLEMDWAQWIGYAHMGIGAGALPAPTTLGVPGGCATMTGGFLVLKPSQDITLQTGQAPSLVGNFTFQFNLTVRNNTEQQVTPQLYVITANSGFFESIRGSSRIIKGVLSEQDIISAPLAPMGTRSAIARWVGAGMKGMATILGKTPSLMSAKGGDGTGAGSSGGLGTGGLGTGGLGTGGVGAGRRKGMSARLM